MVYTPDNWVVIHFSGPDFYKVLGGWTGGYLHGSSWRLNSGIVRVEKEGDYFFFHGNSFSTYRCHKSAYGLKLNNSYVWEQIREKFESKILDGDTDWVSKFKG